jgi:hypothetical protein
MNCRTAKYGVVAKYDVSICGSLNERMGLALIHLAKSRVISMETQDGPIMIITGSVTTASYLR